MNFERKKLIRGFSSVIITKIKMVTTRTRPVLIMHKHKLVSTICNSRPQASLVEFRIGVHLCFQSTKSILGELWYWYSSKFILVL